MFVYQRVSWMQLVGIMIEQFTGRIRCSSVELVMDIMNASSKTYIFIMRWLAFHKKGPGPDYEWFASPKDSILIMGLYICQINIS